jgi:NodT family efflux transporter outer membrane factor (OMF) lipoprotein
MTLRALLIAVAALLAACKAGPDYRKPEVSAPAEFKEAAGDWKRAEPRDEVERGRWWDIFRDEELAKLIGRVDVSNQSLRAAEARLRQAQAVVAASRASLFPTLDADVSITRSRSPGGVSGGVSPGRTLTSRSASLNASWDADLWGRLRRAVESDVAAAQASGGDLAAARLSLQAQLATNYFQLRVLDTQRKLLDDTVAAFRRSLTLTENRYRAGVGARADVVQADTQLKTTQAQAVEVGVQRAQLEHAIALLVGAAPAEFSIAPQPTFSAELPVVPAGLPSTLLERRPDVAAAERRVAAANAEIGVAQAAFFPSLTLAASAGYRSTVASQWLSAPSLFWSLGPALAMTLFDAGRREALTEQARAAYDATVADYRQTALQSFQEVEDSLAAVRILEEQARLQSEAVEAARLAVQLTTNQYKAGTTSYLSVVQVQATQLANERTQVGIVGERLAATVALVRALGGGWRAADLPPAR